MIINPTPPASTTGFVKADGSVAFTAKQTGVAGTVSTDLAILSQIPNLLVYEAILDIDGAGTPTATVLINTLVGNSTNNIVWTKNATGVLRGTPDAGVFPTFKKGLILVNSVSATGVPTTVWNQLGETVNSPRVFQITSSSNVSGVVTVADAITQTIFVIIHIFV